MKILTLFLLITLSCSAPAQDYSTLGSLLYPTKVDEQAYFRTFMIILEDHKKGNDPLMGGKGPSIHKFQIDKMKFGFLTNVRKTVVDIVLFNWDLDVFDDLKEDPKLTELYGKPIYILKNVDSKSISSQGFNGDKLSNFSYLLGANYFAESLRINFPGSRVSEEMANWKPHREYMERNHPLRKTLNTETLVLLSPSEDLFFSQAGESAEAQSYFRRAINATGGFRKVMLGTTIHEMFHVKEGIDQTLGLAKARTINVDRKRLKPQLDDSRLRMLISVYARLVFKLGDHLPARGDSKYLLAQLATIIKALKVEFPNAWNFIWDYEYKEGFAEFSSAQSVVTAGLFSLSEKIELLKNDSNNNVAYRTGAIGGLYLYNHLQGMIFSDMEDHSKSVWELVLEQEQVVADGNLEDIILQNQISQQEFEPEIESIKDYLTSTVRE